jgi:hypothetical protein
MVSTVAEEEDEGEEKNEDVYVLDDSSLDTLAVVTSSPDHSPPRRSPIYHHEETQAGVTDVLPSLLLNPRPPSSQLPLTVGDPNNSPTKHVKSRRPSIGESFVTSLDFFEYLKQAKDEIALKHWRFLHELSETDKAVTDGEVNVYFFKMSSFLLIFLSLSLSLSLPLPLPPLPFSM